MDGPVRHDVETLGGTEEQVGGAGIDGVRVVGWRSDEQVVVTVAIDVAGIGNAVAELGVGRSATERAIRGAVADGFRGRRGCRGSNL
jgi:hypothetical protein